MPQQFQTLRCYSCEKFQVHQTKKATKWQCKVCGEKQSLKKAYFIGSARDCRLNVQQLNFQDGERKQNIMIGQDDESFDNFEEFPQDNQDIINEFENGLETFQSLEDGPTLHDHYIPKKKARYETDPFFETFSENQSTVTSIFHEDDGTNSSLNQSKSSQGNSSCEESVTFDVAFDLNSPSSKSSDPSFENNNGASELKIKCGINCLDVDTQLPRKRPAPTKNRGFQLILNAAKKLT